MMAYYPNSIVAGACGLIAGAIVSSSLGLKKWRLPSFVRTFARTYILPLVESSPAGPRPISPSVDGQPVRETPVTAQNLVPEPTEEMITLLEGMGFSRDRVLEALRVANNDVQRAAAHLVDRD
ncbi:hypothetical protein HDV00_003858 [Rhizophlyctis rosea]|nr:hypothetical protein HDV00_003858 [Rhizophlyctis rosea]